MSKPSLFFFFFLLLSLPTLAQNETNIRLTRLEVKGEESEKRIEASIQATKAELNGKIEATKVELNGKIEATKTELSVKIEALSDKINYTNNLMLVIIGGIFGLVGFIVWDRATAQAPLRKKQEELEERESRIEKALQEYARTNADMAQSLKNAGI